MGFENKYIPLSQLLVTVYLIESFFILFGKAEKMLHQMFKYVNGGVFSWFSSQSCSKNEECCEQCLDHIQPIAVNIVYNLVPCYRFFNCSTSFGSQFVGSAIVLYSHLSISSIHLYEPKEYCNL